MLTAFISPARCVEVSCFANASTATRPSASYGNKAAAMPCTLRRGSWRLSNSSTVMLDLHNLDLHNLNLHNRVGHMSDKIDVSVSWRPSVSPPDQSPCSIRPADN